MPRYLLAYHGGHLEETPQGQQRVMEEFRQWFGQLGQRLVDPGNPVWGSATIQDGEVIQGGGANPISGYTVIDVDDMDTAIELAKQSPVARGGRTVEVVETRPLV